MIIWEENSRREPAVFLCVDADRSFSKAVRCQKCMDFIEYSVDIKPLSVIQTTVDYYEKLS